MNERIKTIIYISIAILFANATFFFGVWISGYQFVRNGMALVIFIWYFLYNILCITVFMVLFNDY